MGTVGRRTRAMSQSILLVYAIDNRVTDDTAVQLNENIIIIVVIIIIIM
jgi:hypothetical protein